VWNHPRQSWKVDENPKLDAVLRYKFLSLKFVILATQAASSEECCILIENALDSLCKQVEGLMSACQSNPTTESDDQEIDETSKKFFRTARLKKKLSQKRTSHRAKTWLDRQHKIKKRAAKVGANQPSVCYFIITFLYFRYYTVGLSIIFFSTI
jgi:hypothetical protein